MKGELKDLENSIRRMDSFDPKLYTQADPPLVSIYVPADHDEREMRRDEATRIAFKGLADCAERTLERDWGEHDWSGIADKLAYLESHEDLATWLGAHKGLAFLINNDTVYTFNLSVEVEPTVVVGDKYYLKPLLRNQIYGAQYYLLALSNDRFGVIKGDQDKIERLTMPDDVQQLMNDTFPALVGTQADLDDDTVNGHLSPYHLWRSRNDVRKEEREKFFRQVNKALSDILLKNDPTPVILVSLPEHQTIFRNIATLPTLMATGIEKDPDALNGSELRDEAMAIVEIARDHALKDAIDKYNYDKSKGKASDDINEIGMALLERKVETLFVQQGKNLPGTYDVTTGVVILNTTTDPADSKELDPAGPDLIDALAQTALAQKASILVIPADEMPTSQGVAAIYRY